VRHHLQGYPGLLNKPVGMLTAIELKRWRNDLIESGIKGATVVRVLKSARASLNLAAITIRVYRTAMHGARAERRRRRHSLPRSRPGPAFSGWSDRGHTKASFPARDGNSERAQLRNLAACRPATFRREPRYAVSSSALSNLAKANAARRKAALVAVLGLTSPVEKRGHSSPSGTPPASGYVS